MVISVDDRLESLYNELKNRGYEVYRFGDREISDVVIYSGENTSITSSIIGELSSKISGVFLINGDYIGLPEIEAIISSKTYSSIF